MTMIGHEQSHLDAIIIDDANLAAHAHLFHALSDPTRLAIMQHLTLGEHRVRDLVHHLGLAQSTISVHIARLRDCGLVRSRSVGRSTLVSLRDPAALNHLLGSTTQLLQSTQQLADCLTVSADDRRSEHHLEEKAV